MAVIDAAHALLAHTSSHMLFALLGSGAGALVEVLHVFAPAKADLYGIDTAANLTCVLTQQSAVNSKMEEWLFNSGQYALMVPTLVGMPGLMLVAVYPSRAMVAAVLVALVTGFLVFIVLWMFVGILPGMAALVLPALLSSLAFKCTAPRDTDLWFNALLICPLILVVLGFVLVIGSFSSQTLQDKLILSCVAFPLGKELAAVPARVVVRAFVREESSRKSGLARARQGSEWVVVLTISTTFAILARLATASLQGGWLVASVLFQGALEVVLRLTMHSRDMMLSKAGSKVSKVLCCCCRRSAKKKQPGRRSIAPRMTYMATRLNLANSGSDAQVYASALISNAEVVAEYMGIFISTWLVIVLRERALAVPAQIFAEQPRPFEEPIGLDVLATTTFIMLITETVVDLACAAYARRRGKRLEAAWFKVPPARRLAVVLAAGFVATGSAMLGFIFSSNNTAACNGRNLCFCAAGNGIRAGTLEDLYCLRLFPDTDGYPPGLHAMAVLEAPTRARWSRARVELDLLRPMEGLLGVPVVMAGDQHVPLGLEVSQGHELSTVREWMLDNRGVSASSVLLYMDDEAPAEPQIRGSLCNDTLPTVRLQATPAALERALRELFNATDCDGPEEDDCVKARVASLVASHPDCIQLPHRAHRADDID